MKKIILLFIIAVVLTGCTAKYQITINEDLTITEEAQLSGTDEFFSTYYKSTKKNVLKTQLDSYKDILDENEYQYKLIEEDIPYILLQKNILILMSILPLQYYLMNILMK